MARQVVEHGTQTMMSASSSMDHAPKFRETIVTQKADLASTWLTETAAHAHLHLLSK